MKGSGWKVFLSVLSAGLATYFRELILPLIILIAVMTTDYITGLACAWITKTVSAQASLKGIVKKILCLVLVAVGMTVEYLLDSVLVKVGLKLPIYGMIGLVVTMWLIINELISVLENLAQSGVPIPDFLVKLVEKLKVVAENQFTDESEEESEKEPEKEKEPEDQEKRG